MIFASPCDRRVTLNLSSPNTSYRYRWRLQSQFGYPTTSTINRRFVRPCRTNCCLCGTLSRGISSNSYQADRSSVDFVTVPHRTTPAVGREIEQDVNGSFINANAGFAIQRNNTTMADFLFTPTIDLLASTYEQPQKTCRQENVSDRLITYESVIGGMHK